MSGLLFRAIRPHSVVAMLVVVLGAMSVATHAGVAEAADGATCLTSEGKTACGYHCLASHGQVRCAQRPDGVCFDGAGTITCWDPPPLLRTIFGTQVPRARCVASSGQVACGYSCLANYDRVLCAQTPFGSCKANEGRLVCWDPPGQIIVTNAQRTPVASCVSSYGKVACGYDCVGNYGVVRCAKTPKGFCRSEREPIICWDPPISLEGVAFDPSSEMGCMSTSTGESSCGYSCLATRHESRCATARDHVCRVVEGKVECLDSNRL